MANDGSVSFAVSLSFVNQTQFGCICLKKKKGKKKKAKTSFEVEEMLAVFHPFYWGGGNPPLEETKNSIIFINHSFG